MILEKSTIFVYVSHRDYCSIGNFVKQRQKTSFVYLMCDNIELNAKETKPFAKSCPPLSVRQTILVLLFHRFLEVILLI